MELIVATHNKGKVAEFARLFADYEVVLLPLDAIGIGVEVEETGETFAENARIKAETIFALTGKPTIADDSGLCVDALGGAPGVYSARYGGPGLDDRGRLERLLDEMKDVPAEKRGAHFACAICCVLPEMTVETSGVCRGSILTAPRGENGFGYDPVFLPDEYRASGRSFAELSQQEKNAISHRGAALRNLYESLVKYGALEKRAGV